MTVWNHSHTNTLFRDLRALTADDALAIDTETTGLNIYGNDTLTGISLAYEGAAWYIPIANPCGITMGIAEFGRLIAAINDTKAIQVYHHAPFDWTVLARYTARQERLYCPLFHVPQRVWDTQVGAWLTDENQRVGLKEQGAFWFGEDARAEQTAMKELFKGRTLKDCVDELYDAYKAADDPRTKKSLQEEAKALQAASRRTWATLRATEIGPYAEQDANLTLRLYELQRVDEVNVTPDIDREMAFQGVIYRMIQTGIRVDLDKAQSQLEVAEKRQAEIATTFDVNLGSATQVAEMIYDDWGLECRHKTKGGARSVAKDALEELEGDHPGIEDILEHRQLAKAMSAYYRPFLERADEHGRLHAWFSSTRTVTGRLSSSKPNLQTIPREDTLVGVRDVFIPEDGMELWEYDLVAAELRVMASFAKEETMMSALIEGRDLHSETATSIFGPDFTGLQRRLAKNLTYGFAYGIQAPKFATYIVAGTGKVVTDQTVAQAAHILDGYRRTYPRLVTLMLGLEKVARRDGRLPLHIPGRYRRFRGPGYSGRYYTALNAIVQGGIGEFMKDIMLRVEQELPLARLCLQVHDSLVFEVHPGTGQQVGAVLQSLADEISPFPMPMKFEGKQW